MQLYVRAVAGALMLGLAVSACSSNGSTTIPSTPGNTLAQAQPATPNIAPDYTNSGGGGSRGDPAGGSAGSGSGGGCAPNHYVSTSRSPVAPDDCSGGGGGVTPVALRSPTPGANCWASPGTLGDNLPANSSGSSTEITNIFPIFANNSAGAPDVLAWMYVTQSGDWLQENPQFSAFWSSLAASVPVLGTLASALSSGGIVQTSSSQWTAVMNYVNGHNGYIGSCFTSSLG
jgi:hypothetical protein